MAGVPVFPVEAAIEHRPGTPTRAGRRRDGWAGRGMPPRLRRGSAAERLAPRAAAAGFPSGGASHHPCATAASCLLVLARAASHAFSSRLLRSATSFIATRGAGWRAAHAASPAVTVHRLERLPEHPSAALTILGYVGAWTRAGTRRGGILAKCRRIPADASSHRRPGHRCSPCT